MALGQPDRAAHARGDGRGGDRDAQARGDAVIGLEEAQPGVELLGEGRARVVGEAGGEALGRLVIGRPRGLHELAPAVGQSDGDRAAVLGVGLAGDEPGALQARETDAHRPRRPAHLGHELALGQSVTLGVEQGREDLEARA